MKNDVVSSADRLFYAYCMEQTISYRQIGALGHVQALDFALQRVIKFSITFMISEERKWDKYSIPRAMTQAKFYIVPDLPLIVWSVLPLYHSIGQTLYCLQWWNFPLVKVTCMLSYEFGSCNWSLFVSSIRHLKCSATPDFVASGSSSQGRPYIFSSQSTGLCLWAARRLSSVKAHQHRAWTTP